MAYTVLKRIALMTSLFVIDIRSILKSYAFESMRGPNAS